MSKLCVSKNYFLNYIITLSNSAWNQTYAKKTKLNKAKLNKNGRTSMCGHFN